MLEGEPMSLVLRVGTLNHWTTRAVPEAGALVAPTWGCLSAGLLFSEGHPLAKASPLSRDSPLVPPTAGLGVCLAPWQRHLLHMWDIHIIKV